MQKDVHPLSYSWTFYYYFEKPGTPSVSSSNDTLNSYRKNLHEIFHFGTIEEFWAHYQHIVRPTGIPVFSSYKVFRKDIPPEWEFPLHKGGGMINFYAPHEQSAHIFELITIALIGGCFEEYSPKISGLNLTNKGTTTQFALWIQRVDEPERDSIEKIREYLETILTDKNGIGQAINIGYKKFENE